MGKGNLMKKEYIVYKIFYQDGLVYIGRTGNLLAHRLQSHASAKTIEFKKVKNVQYAICDTESDMMMYEVYYINKLKPRFNTFEKGAGTLNVKIPDLTFTDFDFTAAAAGCKKLFDLMPKQYKRRLPVCKFKELRQSKGFTSDQLIRVAELDMAQWLFSYMERGIVMPIPEDLEKICTVLECMPLDLYDKEQIDYMGGNLVGQN